MLVARANGWGDATKAVALVSCLRGRARAVLGTLEDPELFAFSELKAKLEVRFGESAYAQDYYLQFTNRRQGSGEDFATLGAELERLSKLAYPECTTEAREKIACSQFVAALSDGYIRQALQLEGITSLRMAVERAKTVKIINENSFPKRKEGTVVRIPPAEVSVRMVESGKVQRPEEATRRKRPVQKGRTERKKSVGNAEPRVIFVRNARA
ncbi:hypothetical protein X777_10513 [Ooceraea biroi]|uniref:Retrotransposon gag domain-containing protein n=1 Tax=Ooceraea biroi TaxID=2015173 RepID=A0A026X115_OOCBI|nr:hypothetical protein X777_10513 [Ooceraea biroi]